MMTRGLRENTSGLNSRDKLRADLLAQRLSAVASASALNARTLQLIQQFAGLEMEALRLELELQRQPGNIELAEALAGLHGQFEALSTSQNECAEQLDGCEGEIARIDLQLALAGAAEKGGHDEPA